MRDLNLEKTYQHIFEINNKKTRWYKCRICSEQFAYRRLLEVHKKAALKHSSVCSKVGK